MNPTLLAEMLAALAAEPRVRAVQAMVVTGARGVSAGALAQLCRVSPSTMSFHLNHLRLAGLVESRREGRTLYYIANLAALEALGTALARGLVPDRQTRLRLEGAVMSAPEAPLTVLFLCTGNSARSLIAESILTREGTGRFRAVSAGSHPRGAPHPEALAALRRAGYPTEGLRSKNWDEFAGANAPTMDFVFTVCDDAAAETCPVWPGQPMTAHWGVPDPAAFQGTEAATAAIFNDTFRMLFNRISLFVSLPLASLDRLSLQQRVQAIGAMAQDPQATEAPGSAA